MEPGLSTLRSRPDAVLPRLYLNASHRWRGASFSLPGGQPRRPCASPVAGTYIFPVDAELWLPPQKPRCAKSESIFVDIPVVIEVD